MGGVGFGDASHGGFQLSPSTWYPPGQFEELSVVGQLSRVISPAGMGACSPCGIARESGVFGDPAGGSGWVGGCMYSCSSSTTTTPKLKLRSYLTHSCPISMTAGPPHTGVILVSFITHKQDSGSAVMSDYMGKLRNREVWWHPDRGHTFRD